MKAKDKIERWLDECGYVHGQSVLVYLFKGELRTVNFVSSGSFTKEYRILSLTNPDGKVHIPPADLHEDDNPEPRDKVLQKCLRESTHLGRYLLSALYELNNRLKALESILLDGGKGV